MNQDIEIVSCKPWKCLKRFKSPSVVEKYMTIAVTFMMHDNKAYNANIALDLKGLCFRWLEMPSVCDLVLKENAPQ